MSIAIDQLRQHLEYGLDTTDGVTDQKVGGSSPSERASRRSSAESTDCVSRGPGIRTPSLSFRDGVEVGGGPGDSAKAADTSALVIS